MAEDRPVSTVNPEHATPPPSLLAFDTPPLEPPRASFFSPGPGPSISEASPRDSRAQSTTGPEVDKENSTPANSATLLPAVKPEDSEDPFSPDVPRTARFSRGRVWLAIAAGTILVLILVIILPVYFSVHKSHKNQSNIGNPTSSATSSSSGSGPSPSPTGSPKTNTATSGGDGSTVTSGNTTFVYSNPFGGFWYYDPNDPFNNAATPNSWTKPLNQTWDWATDRLYGVNLGGLFVLEPFISPALFQKYPTTVDEWTLSVAMAADANPGGGLQAQLEAHYNTFITEQDIAQMAGAGLNWIRLPIPFWAIETWPGEPFLAKVSWKYILRIFAWARKYGIRINLDLHTIPGSQNALNHSGKMGQINFMSGIMGIANAQRTLDYIRFITEFISQPQYQNLIPVFSIVNEAMVAAIGQNQMMSFYLHAHNIIRGITGYGAGNGPYIAIHDGFQPLTAWVNILPGADRVILDTHPYFAFDGQPNNQPIDTNDGIGEPGGVWPLQACTAWGPSFSNSQANFGVTITGEFSSAYTNCGLFVLGTANPATVTGNCVNFLDQTTWSAAFKQGVLDFTLASMDASQNWFFWTWKVGLSATTGTVQAPLWSYQLGLQNGWVPKDPRTSLGKCKALGANQAPFAGAYAAWQTGGAGAGQIAPNIAAKFPWPPATLAGVVGDVYAALPTYTPTGVIPTLPPPQLTPSAPEGNGWFNTQDKAGAMVPVVGCNYPNAWDLTGAVAPAAPCPAGAPPLITAAPAAPAAPAAAPAPP